MEKAPLEVKYYDLPLKGISNASGNLIEVFGESKVEHKGKILEQYLYNFIDFTPMNGQPYANLKENITLI